MKKNILNILKKIKKFFRGKKYFGFVLRKWNKSYQMTLGMIILFFVAAVSANFTYSYLFRSVVKVYNPLYDFGKIEKQYIARKGECKEGRYGKIDTETKKVELNDFGVVSDLSDWKEYENNVLGIRFSYPAEWGYVTVSPLTDLSKVKDEYYKKNNEKLESIRINFSKEHYLEMRAFSDDYQGGLYEYKSAEGVAMKSDNNFEELKAESSICEYRHDLDLANSGGEYVMDAESRCNSQVKLALKETGVPGYAQCTFKYILRALAFKKLENGEFDNMFIERRFVDGYSEKDSKQSLSGIDDYVESFLDKEEYEKDLMLFNTFVSTIEVFKPKDERIKGVQREKDDNEDTLLIKKYYSLIQEGNLKSAYAMKSTSMSFDDFKAMYENVYIAKPFNFTKIDDGKYDFRVEYQEDNTKPVEYHVVTEVKNGKLVTSFTEIIQEELIVNDKLRVASIIRDDYTYVIVFNEGRENIIDKSKYFPGEYYTGEIFGGFKLINDRYIRYSVGGWEWSFMRLYDLEEKKMVLNLDSGHNSDFTNDGRRFYVCALNHFGGAQYVDVYSVPEFKKKLDFFEVNNEFDKVFIENLKCEYDKRNDVLDIMIEYRSESNGNAEWYSPSIVNRKWRYYFDKNELKEVK